MKLEAFGTHTHANSRVNEQKPCKTVTRFRVVLPSQSSGKNAEVQYQAECVK